MAQFPRNKNRSTIGKASPNWALSVKILSFSLILFQIMAGVNDEDDNIVQNPKFEQGLHNWSGRGSKIALYECLPDGEMRLLSGKLIAAATGRTQTSNGIQQDITGKVQQNLDYEVVATVRLQTSGKNVRSTDVRVTLWVQTPDSYEQYIHIANGQVTEKDWVDLRGKFLIDSSPSKVVISIEGPPPGVDILLKKLVVKQEAKIPPPRSPLSREIEYLRITFGHDDEY